MTWRKNGLNEYTTLIDHVYYSTPISLQVELEATESDHKSMKITVNSVGRCKGVAYPADQSRLSKRTTLKSDPRSWTSYPTFQNFAFYGPNKTRWSLRTESQYQE